MEQGESTAPQFIRDFSKEHSPEEYKQTVSSIKEKREEFHQNKNERLEKQSNLKDSVTKHEQTLGETLTELHTLRDHIDQLSNSRFNKLIHYFSLKKGRNDIDVLQKKYQELTYQQELETSEQQATTNQIQNPPEIQKAKDLLGEFYRNQKDKWAKSDYTKEDIKKYFSEEYLSSLSLPDYITLLKRFPSEMVAHVTRQGIRDHIGLSFYHETGAGEYSDGFMKIVQDGRLRSPLGIHLVEKENKKAIANFLRLDKFSNQEDALKELSTITNKESQGIAGTYVDRMAIHFATEEVADCYYGSETGNEIFFAYPSALIASQYFFGGQLSESKGGYHNDQWVWANEEKGININTGLVFIPAKAQVDKKTGSRYQLDENNNPIKNSEYHSVLKRFVNSPEFYDNAQEIMEISGKLDQDISSIEFSSRNRSLIQRLEPYRQKLDQQFDIKDKRLQDSILDYQNLFNIVIHKQMEDKGENDPFSNVDSLIYGALSSKGILFLESQNTINSKDFWENYFNQNPNKRPSKIIYYQGQDPTLALQHWKQENGLTKKASDVNIGFTEQQIQRNDPRATAGLDRFQSLAQEVIKEYFSQKENTPK